MKMLFCCLALLSFSGVGFAKEYAENMTFTPFVECGKNFCNKYVLASGVIDDGAPSRLEAYIKRDPDSSKIVAFDSPGGSLVAGLRMGQVIRAYKLDSVVAGKYVSRESAEASETLLANDVICFSACSYAFIGGVSRWLRHGFRIGVHQFYGDQKLSDEGETQTIVAILSQYFKEMGVDRDLLDVASVTKSNEMAEIPYELAAKYNLDNQYPHLEQWHLQATEEGEPLATVNQQKNGSDARTWIAVGRAANVHQFVITVKHGVLQRKSYPDIAKRLASMHFMRARICANDETCVQLRTLDPWKYDEETETIDGAFVVNTTELLDVFATKGDHVFVSGFPSEEYRLSPSVELGLTGVKRALLAVIKADP